MIRPLRQRHRRVVIVLGFFLPLAFVAGIAARRPVPSVENLPKELLTPAKSFAAAAWERGDLFSKNAIQVHRLRESADAGQFAVSFSAPKAFVKPDLMVYWVAGNPAITDTLPNNAILLGSFNAGPLPLPDEVVKAGGRLVLFSLADNEIADVSKPVQFNDSTK